MSFSEKFIEFFAIPLSFLAGIFGQIIAVIINPIGLGAIAATIMLYLLNARSAALALDHIEYVFGVQQWTDNVTAEADRLCDKSNTFYRFTCICNGVIALIYAAICYATLSVPIKDLLIQQSLNALIAQIVSFILSAAIGIVIIIAISIVTNMIARKRIDTARDQHKTNNH